MTTTPTTGSDAPTERLSYGDNRWAFDPTPQSYDHLGHAPAPGTGSPSVDATTLWSGGIATALVAALVGLVGHLLLRVMLEATPFARDAAVFSGAHTVLVCSVAGAAALAATGLAQLLVISTPRPLSYFGWIVALLTAAAVVMPFVAGTGLVFALGTAVINLVIGLAIGGLVSGSAAAATRRREE